MALSTFILSELYSGGVTYGRELQRRFAEAGITSWGRVAHSSVYRALDRLRERGLVARWREEGSRRNRKFYLITKAGRRAFEALLAGEIAQPRTYRNPLNIAVHCVFALPGPRAVSLLEERRARLAEHEREAGRVARAARRGGPDAAFERLAAERILMKSRAELFFAGSLADYLAGFGERRGPPGWGGKDRTARGARNAKTTAVQS